MEKSPCSAGTDAIGDLQTDKIAHPAVKAKPAAAKRFSMCLWKDGDVAQACEVRCRIEGWLDDRVRVR